MRGMRIHTAIRSLAAGLLAAGALSVAACAGGDPAADAADRKTEAREAALEYAQCMRENGVEDFPDPGPNGAQRLKVGPGEGIRPEEFEAGDEACRKHMDDVEPPELSEAEQQEFKDAALAHARCMRENGVENFPDPTFGGNGEAAIHIGKDSGLDPDDLAEAEKACEDEMPKGADDGKAP